MATVGNADGGTGGDGGSTGNANGGAGGALATAVQAAFWRHHTVGGNGGNADGIGIGGNSGVSLAFGDGWRRRPGEHAAHPAAVLAEATALAVPYVRQTAAGSFSV